MKRMAAGLAIVAALVTAQAAPAGWRHYTDRQLGYEISYPPGWSIDTHYVSVSLGPDHEIHGVAFTIPAAMTRGTNLGSDTKLSVESIPGHGCKPAQFVDPADDVHRTRENGLTWTVASSSDAGAGNRYETTVFVADKTSPCLAVRYFIHSSAIGNFDPGTVKEFDHARLVAAFDRIRATLKLGK